MMPTLSARTRRLFLLSLLLSLLALPVVAQDRQPLYSLPRGSVYTSSSLALTRSGRVVVAANMLNNTVSLVEPLQGRVLAEIPVGRDPRMVAITPDDSRALVVNRGDGTLSIVDIAGREVLATWPLGPLPYGVVTDSNSRAFVALQGSHEIIEISLETGAVLARIAVPDDPAGLALWGDFLYVTHFWSGQLSLVYLPEGLTVRTVQAGPQASLLQSIEINPTNGIAYLPRSISNAAGPAPSYDSRIMPVLDRVDLSSMRVLQEQRIGLNIADRPVNMPFAVRIDRLRNWAYVVNAGSNDLSVIDLNTGQARAHIPVGANPRGLVFSLDAAFVYVHNAIDGTLTIVETRTLAVRDVLPISTLTIPIDTFIGAQLFHTSGDLRMNTGRMMSCASCHFDGQSDGRTWGGRPTPTLYGLLGRPDYAGGQWGSLSAVELHIRELQGGSGLVEGLQQAAAADDLSGRSIDLDALVTYLAGLQEP